MPSSLSRSRLNHQSSVRSPNGSSPSFLLWWAACVSIPAWGVYPNPAHLPCWLTAMTATPAIHPFSLRGPHHSSTWGRHFMLRPTAPPGADSASGPLVLGAAADPGLLNPLSAAMAAASAAAAVAAAAGGVGFSAMGMGGLGTPTPSAPRRHGGAYDDTDEALSTNLYIGNLHPQVRPCGRARAVGRTRTRAQLRAWMEITLPNFVMPPGRSTRRF